MRRVFGAGAAQVDIYEQLVRPMVGPFLAGFNSALLAYGQVSEGFCHSRRCAASEHTSPCALIPQTGSGKTYTMGTNYKGGGSGDMGGDDSDDDSEAAAAAAAASGDDSLGIIPRLVSDVLEGLRSSAAASFRLSATYLEIYNEAVRDLLRDDGVPPPAGGHPLVRDR